MILTHTSQADDIEQSNESYNNNGNIQAVEEHSDILDSSFE